MPHVPFSNVYIDIIRSGRNSSTGATGGTANQTVIASGLRCRISSMTTNDWMNIPPEFSQRNDIVRRRIYKLRLPSGFDVAEGDTIQNIVMLNQQQYWPSLQNVADGPQTGITARVKYVMEADPGPLGTRKCYVDVNITTGPTAPYR